jgi:hypothetical protein
MKRSEVLARLKEMGLRGETISFYSTYDREKDECVESPDTSFGDCEISSLVGNIVDCCALGDDGKIYNFQAGEWLVGGALGKIAGAF